MFKKINKILESIEKRYNVKIIFAIESGSRVWNMASKDSDYDVRFVYYHPIQEYLRVTGVNETIHDSYNIKGEKVPIQGCDIDLQGMDIRKYARMLFNSNPTMIEWTISHIIYKGIQPKTFVDFATKRANPKSLFYHYRSMGKQNYQKYIRNGEQTTHKKYLYSMRGIINSLWVAQTETVPPLDFQKTIYEIKGVPIIITERLKEIIKIKTSGKEKDIVGNIQEFDKFIEEKLSDYSDEPTHKRPDLSKEIDNEVFKILMEE
jgi:predicted nucleotidyltransferase